MTDRESWLVCFDTDRIKEYVFHTGRLKSIRGGSALLTSLDVERKKQLEGCFGKHNLVYCAGGSGAVLVDTEDEATTLAAEIERDFRNATITGSTTAIALPPPAPDIADFGKRMAQASECLGAAKAAKAELGSLPVEPYMRPCGECGQYAATTRTSDAPDTPLCDVCEKRREWGTEEREASFKEFAGFAAKQNPSHTWKTAKNPSDLDTIGAISVPSNYIGLISLDGNQMGKCLHALGGVEHYKSFSHALEKFTKDQIFAALTRYGVPRPSEQDGNSHSDTTFPFEIVLVGGDDVVLITAADIAMDIALTIATGFEGNSVRDVLAPLGLRDKLTMAGGVVLAHADFPLLAMHNLAEQAQKEAKKACAAGGYKTGAIDFLVVSGGADNLEISREKLPHRRPYELTDLKKLLGYGRKFKANNFPTSQLQQMYQSMFVSEGNAQLACISALAYLAQKTDKNQFSLLKQFFADFGVKDGGNLPPWDDRKRNGRNVSALTDLVELYPFIRSEEGNDAKYPH